MKVHNFFPLSILQDQIKLTDEEKINLIKDIRVMKSNSQNSDYQKMMQAGQVIHKVMNTFLISLNLKTYFYKLKKKLKFI